MPLRIFGRILMSETVCELWSAPCMEGQNIRSVKKWRRKEVDTTVLRQAKRRKRGDLSLDKAEWSRNDLGQFLRHIYRESFPSPLIGEKNVDTVVNGTVDQLMALRKSNYANEECPLSIKSRYINWLLHVKCESQKRRVIINLTNFVKKYLESIVRYSFKSVNRLKGTVFLPCREHRSISASAFNVHAQECELARCDTMEENGKDLKMRAVGKKYRPIVMNGVDKDTRKFSRLCLTALRFHANEFGVSSYSISTCAKRVQEFASKNHNEILFLKTDIKRFYPSVDQQELIDLVKDMVKWYVFILFAVSFCIT
ncbi:hypothetical protein PFISCL1PPCAC_19913 [Pristionchus fissidentatus]|uniref:Reverse transcriptase domain-containing protein n=1 Tax=Pristionchus fissidentatus TaxID=1538716 RepID=A0AAV5W9R6_9BILA|nr:hypothetical protein PFISCL1PPCAC_19913 [Pristionchus fissidentatus]